MASTYILTFTRISFCLYQMHALPIRMGLVLSIQVRDGYMYVNLQYTSYTLLQCITMNDVHQLP